MFLVIEMQTNNGTIAHLAYSYNTMPEADSKFYSIMSAAAISNIPKHGAVLLDEDCHILKAECYKHEIESEVTNE